MGFLEALLGIAGSAVDELIYSEEEKAELAAKERLDRDRAELAAKTQQQQTMLVVGGVVAVALIAAVVVVSNGKK